MTTSFSRPHQSPHYPRALVASLVLTCACQQANQAPAESPADRSELTASDDEGPAPLDPQEIAEAIDRELYYDGCIDRSLVEVRVQPEGLAVLEGSVPDLLSRRRASRLAAGVKGVRSIDNRLRVDVESRSDQAIRQDVRRKLESNPGTKELKLDVRVTDQEVALKGSVPSALQRELALKAARSVLGVRAVESELALAYPVAVDDAEVATLVRARLEQDALLGESPLAASVEAGRVSLRGTVGSLLQKLRAERRAWVNGTQSVDASGVLVDWNTYIEQDPRTEPSIDIEETINAALVKDPRINAFSIVTSVDDVLVTLRGGVSTLKVKRIAERIARDTVGVVEVVNEIVVQPDLSVSDAGLQRAVQQAFRASPLLHDLEAEVQASSGVVTLSGSAPTYAMKAEADYVASGVPGVTEIRNDLTAERPVAFAYDPYNFPYYPHSSTWEGYVPEETALADEEIESAIERELFWSPFVDEEEVEVEVDDGSATLKGQVRSFHALSAAMANAYEGGATSIWNEVRVAGED